MQSRASDAKFRRVSLVAALLVCVAPSAHAQDYCDYYGQSPTVVSQVSGGSALLADIEARLAALEAMQANDTPESACQEVDIITKPTHKLRGRIYWDQLWMDNLEGAVPQPVRNQTGFDTARIGIEGNVYENVKYKAEWEFEGTETDYKDVYMEVTMLPYAGNFRIGYFKEPMGLERLTSSRFVTFMERSTPTEAFTPNRHLGLMFYNYFGGEDGTQNWSWFAGLFRGNSLDNNPDVDRDANDWCGTFRVAGLPYYDEATPGRCLLHVGVSGSTRRTGGAGGTVGNGRSEGFLELDSRDSLIQIQLAPGQEYDVLGLEAAWVRGAFSLQGEYFFSATGDFANINTNGGYVMASYFLTGENRGYKKSSKAFDRVKPYEPFFRVRTADGIATGIGAWELAARYSYTDLNSLSALAGALVTTTPPVVIGTQENITLGVNWYLNPYSRIMCNYVHSISDYAFIGKSEGDHVGVRFQVDW